MELILASASPRRRELLHQIGVAHLCEPANIDESRLAGEKPEDYVLRMAREKAAAVASRHSGGSLAVLAADTSVVIDEDVLGKPGDHFEALGMLARLSGRSHRVLTGICLNTQRGEVLSEMVETKVHFLQLTREQCESYLATPEPWDKAGGYGIQGLAGAFVSSIEGSYSNVVGLPLAQTWQLLSGQGIKGALENTGE
ncbi:septum formation inhibitor Maf [Halieaceae bacterium IMCC8485]|uniref:dTTP/UTP pyrophosphatase n=1 Tax=Candidatus Seongchinamella marina TaxID=2518990 RepID=A0ABT3SR81_9GAMM|nr:Maf family protein [Candidatus Seongchinamella marina]MCX2972486.1 septum formation inhibitor Maf [Candidatus Seongchinamella marina]